jgi:hypothetical protein
VKTVFETAVKDRHPGSASDSGFSGLRSANIRVGVDVDHTSHSPEEPQLEPPPVESTVPAALLRDELERVLASREFQSSKLCQQFMRYVEENTLNGHPDTLKERTIGIEVLGKPASYEPSEDAAVRVRAGEVRKRLRSYYSGKSGAASVLIDLPPGTYVPEFRYSDRAAASPGPPQPRRRWRWFAGGAILLLALAATTFYWTRTGAAASPFNQFWSPVLQKHKAVLVCAAPVPVYSPVRTASNAPPTRLGDFVLVPGRFVAISDVNAALQISDMLARLEQPYKLRIGNEVTFRDLRSAPVVLVGFSYTQWHEIGEHFRYSIDLSRRPFGVLQDDSPTNWTIHTHPDDPDLDEDYAIVSRVLYPGTNNMIVEIAGISHYGTEAAADLVTNPTLLQDALRKLPAGWEQKNVQIVLHTEVVGGFPSVPTVVATHVW